MFEKGASMDFSNSEILGDFLSFEEFEEIVILYINWDSPFALNVVEFHQTLTYFGGLGNRKI